MSIIDTRSSTQMSIRSLLPRSKPQEGCRPHLRDSRLHPGDGRARLTRLFRTGRELNSGCNVWLHVTERNHVLLYRVRRLPQFFSPSCRYCGRPFDHAAEGKSRNAQRTRGNKMLHQIPPRPVLFGLSAAWRCSSNKQAARLAMNAWPVIRRKQGEMAEPKSAAAVERSRH